MILNKVITNNYANLLKIDVNNVIYVIYYGGTNIMRCLTLFISLRYL